VLDQHFDAISRSADHRPPASWSHLTPHASPESRRYAAERSLRTLVYDSRDSRYDKGADAWQRPAVRKNFSATLNTYGLVRIITGLSVANE